MRIVAVVPVKAAAAGKQRIALALNRDGRERLVRAMLKIVLAALRDSAELAGGYILTPDSSLVPPDMTWIPDGGGGLNRELKRAATVAAAHGIEAVLILPADLPWIGSADIDELLHKARADRILISPDKAGVGTNALVMAPACGMDPCFGEHSFALHSTLAASFGVPALIHYCDNLARDIDEPYDLCKLAGHPSGDFDFLSAFAPATT